MSSGFGAAVLDMALKQMEGELVMRLESEVMNDLVAEFKHAMEPIVKAKVRELLGNIQSNWMRDMRTMENQIYIKFKGEELEKINT